MLIAEDLLLLLTDDASGKTRSTSTIDVALAGAVLLELTLLERVDVAGPDGPVKEGRLVVIDDSTTGDDVLDAALSVCGEKQGDRPKNVLGPLKKGLRPALYDRLVGRGVLRAEEGRVLGLFPTHRWPAEDATHEAAVRRDLEGVLVHGLTPAPRTGALVALLHAIRVVRTVVDPSAHDVGKKVLDRRAKEVAEGSWASEAVRRAVDEMSAAVMAAVTVAAASGASG